MAQREGEREGGRRGGREGGTKTLFVIGMSADPFLSRPKPTVNNSGVVVESIKDRDSSSSSSSSEFALGKSLASLSGRGTRISSFFKKNP